MQTVLEVREERSATAAVVVDQLINQSISESTNSSINQPINIDESIKVREERPATVVHAPPSVVLVQGRAGKVFIFQTPFA